MCVSDSIMEGSKLVEGFAWHVPQARLMVIPSSWAMTPVACRSKDSALAIHRPPNITLHAAAALLAACWLQAPITGVLIVLIWWED